MGEAAQAFRGGAAGMADGFARPPPGFLLAATRAGLDEPCTLRLPGGRVRDGRLRQADAAGAIVAGIGGVELGQEVELVLPRRGMLRLRARIAGLGVLGLLLDLRLAEAAPWREALLALTEGRVRTA
jgi:hypothetical protein